VFFLLLLAPQHLGLGDRASAPDVLVGCGSLWWTGVLSPLLGSVFLERVCDMAGDVCGHEELVYGT